LSLIGTEMGHSSWYLTKPPGQLNLAISTDRQSKYRY